MSSQPIHFDSSSPVQSAASRFQNSSTLPLRVQSSSAALCLPSRSPGSASLSIHAFLLLVCADCRNQLIEGRRELVHAIHEQVVCDLLHEIGRASCRERV